jgi:hypothetical protein
MTKACKRVILIAFNSLSINRILFIDKKAKIPHAPDLEKIED